MHLLHYTVSSTQLHCAFCFHIRIFSDGVQHIQSNKLHNNPEKIRHVSMAEVGKRLSRQTLEENLECFICAEIMSGPIKMCATGHSMCETCVGKINGKCPKCRKEINPLARNYALQYLTDNALPSKGNESTSDENIAAVSCNYRESGCQFTSTEGVEDHEKECEYQPQTCCYASGCLLCFWRGPFNTMVQHIDNRHRVEYKNINEVYVLRFMRCQHYFLYDNNYFTFKINKDIKTHRILFNHLTTKSESNYDYNIKMSHNESGMTKTFAGPCTPSGQYRFQETDGVLDDLLNERKAISVVVTITSKTC